MSDSIIAAATIGFFKDGTVRSVDLGGYADCKPTPFVDCKPTALEIILNTDRDNKPDLEFKNATALKEGRASVVSPRSAKVFSDMVQIVKNTLSLLKHPKTVCKRAKDEEDAISCISADGATKYLLTDVDHDHKPDAIMVLTISRKYGNVVLWDYPVKLIKGVEELYTRTIKPPTKGTK